MAPRRKEEQHCRGHERRYCRERTDSVLLLKPTVQRNVDKQRWRKELCSSQRESRHSRATAENSYCTVTQLSIYGAVAKWCINGDLSRDKARSATRAGDIAHVAQVSRLKGLCTSQLAAGAARKAQQFSRNRKDSHSVPRCRIHENCAERSIFRDQIRSCAERAGSSIRVEIALILVTNTNHIRKE